MEHYNEEVRELEQKQKRKREKWYKLANKAYIIEKEASRIMEEIKKLDIGSSSDMIRIKKAVVRELTKIKQDTII